MAKKQLLLSFHVHEGSHRQQNQYLPGKQSFMTPGRNCMFLTILQTASAGSVCDWRQKQGPEESKLQFLLRDRAHMLLISFSPAAGSLLSWTGITFCPISVLATFISKFLDKVWTRYGGVVVECPISTTTGDLLFKMMSRK